MAKIKLTQGKYAEVDDSDYDFLNKWKWCLISLPGRNLSYAKRSISIGKGKQKHITMHSLLIKPQTGMEIDHIDGNGLNNKRSNLRVCSHTQNMRNCKLSERNKSGFKGVFWNKKNKKWKVSIGVDKKLVHLGYFSDITEAYKTYCESCIKYHGEFSRIK